MRLDVSQFRCSDEFRSKIYKTNDSIRQEEKVNRDRLKQLVHECNNSKEEIHPTLLKLSHGQYIKRKFAIKKLQQRVQCEQQFLSNMAVTLRKRVTHITKELGLLSFSYTLQEILLDRAFSESDPNGFTGSLWNNPSFNVC